MNFFKSIARYISTNIQTALASDSKFTRIRIWRSGYFLEDGTFKSTNVSYALLKSAGLSRRANIGHVSIETKDFYASLWPEQLTIVNKHKVQEGENSDIKTDLISEGRSPDHLVDLETLDLQGMSQELKNFEEHNKYHLIGANKIFNANNAQSCSGLAYSLLVAGGIRKLVPPSISIRDSIIVTPNNLADMVLQAKENELLMKDELERTPIFKK